MSLLKDLDSERNKSICVATAFYLFSSPQITQISHTINYKFLTCCVAFCSLLDSCNALETDHLGRSAVMVKYEQQQELHSFNWWMLLILWPIIPHIRTRQKSLHNLMSSFTHRWKAVTLDNVKLIFFFISMPFSSLTFSRGNLKPLFLYQTYISASDVDFLCWK